MKRYGASEQYFCIYKQGTHPPNRDVLIGINVCERRKKIRMCNISLERPEWIYREVLYFFVNFHPEFSAGFVMRTNQANLACE